MIRNHVFFKALIAGLPALTSSLVLAAGSYNNTTIIGGSGISCSSSCVNGVCENVCSDQQDAKVGNGDIVSEERAFSNFSSVIVSNIETEIVKASQHSVKVISDSNLKKYILVNQNGSELTIRRESGSYRNESMKVVVSQPELVSLDQSGAQQTTVQGFAGQIRVSNDGAGAVVLVDGQFDVLDYKSDGSTTLDSSKSSLSKVRLSVNGVSNVALNFSGKKTELSGSAEGVATINYCGDPEINLERFGVVSLQESCF